MTTGKSIALTRWIFAGKVMSLLFNMLSRLVITFLPRKDMSSKTFLVCCCCWLVSLIWPFCNPMDCSPLGSMRFPWDFPCKNTVVGCHFLLWRIFPTQRLNHVSCLWGRFFTTEPPGKPRSSYIPIVFHSGLSNHTAVLGDTVSAHNNWTGAIATILGEMACIFQELLCLYPSFKCRHEAGQVEAEKFLETKPMFKSAGSRASRMWLVVLMSSLYDGVM